MSTDFKPGQVWKSRDGKGQVRLDAVTHNRVEYTWTVGDMALGHAVSRYVDVFLSEFEPADPTPAPLDPWESVEHLPSLPPGEEEPAPLDPSKVKVGDPVAVAVDDETIGSYEVRGEVRGHLGGTWSVGPVNVASNGAWHEGVTLIDHQPAPEPEPGWKPGTFGSAVVGYKRHQGFVTQAGIFYYLDGIIQRSTLNEPRDFRDFRPLVVVDPAKVDVEAAADAYLREVEGAPGARGRPSLRTKDGMRAALATLGIEAP